MTQENCNASTPTRNQGFVPNQGTTLEDRSVSRLPRVDIIEHEDALTLEMDLAGVEQSGLDIHFEKSTLTVTGDISSEQASKLRPIFCECSCNSGTKQQYRRSFTLSDAFDPQKIEAQLRNGVLTLNIPKSEKQKARKIPIKVRT